MLTVHIKQRGGNKIVAQPTRGPALIYNEPVRYRASFKDDSTISASGSCIKTTAGICIKIAARKARENVKLSSDMLSMTNQQLGEAAISGQIDGITLQTVEQ